MLFLCIELVDLDRVQDFEDALKELEEKVQKNLGGSCTISILDVDHKVIQIKP